MGAFAHALMYDSFHWLDIGGKDAPRIDRHKAYWSHAGVKPETLAEIEGFLK
jgi:hypothetical protein